MQKAEGISLTKRRTYVFCIEETFLQTACVLMDLERVPKGKESLAQMTAGAPVETAGGPTAAAAGAGASMFGDMFSPFASLRRFGNGITGEITPPLLLLSYRPEQRN